MDLFLLINLCSISLIFLISVYLDLKIRKIPKRFFIGYFILSVILNIFEYLLYFNSFVIFILIKVFIVAIVFFLSFILFSLKIFGGSDGKLAILIFIIHPIRFLNISSIFLFYSMFSLLFILFFTFNYIFNIILHDKHSFTLFFNTNFEISIFKRGFFKYYHKFYDYSDLSHYSERKYQIK
ncbi:MAG: prepilin peptidase, partial [Promethearchaeota archaeon]